MSYRLLHNNQLKDVYRVLCQVHGEQRARAIIGGTDKRSEADLRAWRGLGRKGIDAR